MRILDILLKDLKQMLQDVRSLLFLVAMPLGFTLFMGIAYRGAAQPADPRLPVGWINRDSGGQFSQLLRDDLLGSTALRLVELDAEQEDQANRQVDSGELGGVLMIPEGFSADILSGSSPQIVLIVDPVSNMGQSALQLVRVPVTRLFSSVQIAQLQAGQVENPDARPAEFQASLLAADQGWQDAGQSGPVVRVENASGLGAGGFDLKGNPYNQTSPGILFQFAIMSLVSSASLLVVERKTRTLERMLTSSLSRAEIIAGHLLAGFVLVLLQEVVLVVFGQLVLNVDYLRAPLGTLLVMLSLALAVAALGLLIGTYAKTDDQAVLFALIAMFLFSSLGGAWFPLEGSGRVFRIIGGLTPGAWAMTGFQNILIRGLDSASVLLPSAVLLGYAVLFFLLGSWRLRSLS